MSRPKTTTEALLTEWGKWSRSGLGELGATSAMAVAMRLVEPAGNRLNASISDESALRVEAAVRRLRDFDDQQSEAIKLYFVRGLGEVEMSMRLGISLVRGQKLLARAIGWLDCDLNNFSNAA